MLKLDIQSWTPAPDAATQTAAVAALERGDIVYLPDLAFPLEESELSLVEANSALRLEAKSIKYSPSEKKVWGVKAPEAMPMITKVMARYSASARSLADTLLAPYKGPLVQGFSSFRPAEAEGRIQSRRHDDTRLHVDSFPSRPNGGLRILRIFHNANPGANRVWRTGEPFADLAARFAPQIREPLPGSAALMHLLKLTKFRRTRYDHYMLQIHDRMKLDDEYQRTAPQETVQFPSGATWICYTDQVSHAAMSGRYAFEQTFTLPVNAMTEPNLSPLKTLENLWRTAAN